MARLQGVECLSSLRLLWHNVINWFIWNGTLFLTVLEAGEVQHQSASRFSVWWELVVSPWFADNHFLIVSPYGTEWIGRVGKLSCPLPLIRALIPFMRPHPHDLITSQRPHFQMLGIRVSSFEFLRNTNIQFIVHCYKQGFKGKFYLFCIPP